MNNQFQDITQFLKSGLSFQDLYKLKRTSTFGKALLPERTAQRADNLNKRRKELRGDILLKNRGIKNMDVSTLSTTDKITEHQIKMEERLDRLRKWKEMKDKKKTELKLQQKPLFKVCHVPSTVGLPRLENVNKTIKGKVIDLEKSKLGTSKLNRTRLGNSTSNNIKERTIYKNLPAAENKSTKIKEQLRVKPLVQIACKSKQEYKTKSMSETKLNSKNKIEEKDQSKVKLGLYTHKYNTRASKLVNYNKPTKYNKTRKNVKLEEKSNDLKNSKQVDQTIISEENIPNVSEKTPDKSDIPCVYISPFVTISRGKNSARKEYHQRRDELMEKILKNMRIEGKTRNMIEKSLCNPKQQHIGTVACVQSTVSVINKIIF